MELPFVPPAAHFLSTLALLKYRGVPHVVIWKEETEDSETEKQWAIIIATVKQGTHTSYHVLGRNPYKIQQEIEKHRTDQDTVIVPYGLARKLTSLLTQDGSWLIVRTNIYLFVRHPRQTPAEAASTSRPLTSQDRQEVTELLADQPTNRCHFIPAVNQLCDPNDTSLLCSLCLPGETEFDLSCIGWIVAPTVETSEYVLVGTVGGNVVERGNMVQTLLGLTQHKHEKLLRQATGGVSLQGKTGVWEIEVGGGCAATQEQQDINLNVVHNLRLLEVDSNRRAVLKQVKNAGNQHHQPQQQKDSQQQQTEHIWEKDKPTTTKESEPSPPTTMKTLESENKERELEEQALKILKVARETFPELPEGSVLSRVEVKWDKGEDSANTADNWGDEVDEKLNCVSDKDDLHYDLREKLIAKLYVDFDPTTDFTLLSWLLVQQLAFSKEMQFCGHGTLLLCILSFYYNQHMNDSTNWNVLNTIWNTKEVSVDTSNTIDIRFLLGRGVERTLFALKEHNMKTAMNQMHKAYQEGLLEDLGTWINELRHTTTPVE